MPLYAVICRYSVIAAYGTMRERSHILESVHRPGRVGMFIIILFFVMVPQTGFAPRRGTLPRWSRSSCVSVLVCLGFALYVAFAGGSTGLSRSTSRSCSFTILFIILPGSQCMRIAIVGGTGDFGEGIAVRLGVHTDHEVIIGSRRRRKRRTKPRSTRQNWPAAATTTYQSPGW